MKSKIFFIFLLINCSFCKKYTNHTLYRVIPVTLEHLNFLKNLSVYYGVDFWLPPVKVKKPVEFLIAPEDRSTFLREAADRSLFLATIIEDVQRIFDAQRVKPYVSRKTESFDWNSYFRLNDIYNWLRDLVAAHPNDMEMRSIGKSHENRDIMMVRINLNTTNRKRSKVIVEAGIHAREWISPAFVTYFLHSILNAQSSENKALRTIAETYEWYFVPVLNVDGYEYTHTTDRLWRKNRHGNGVDLNRNFGVAFGTTGISQDAYSGIYCGTEAFSERESKLMANFVRSKHEKLEFYLAFHSFGQFIILPYTHSKGHHENFDETKILGDEAAKLIRKRYGTRYQVGTAYDTVGYLASGVSGCWAKKILRVPYVYTFELRDQGSYGFGLPPEQIMPVCLETMDGLIHLLTVTKPFKPLPPGDPETMSGRQENISLDNILMAFCSVMLIVVSFHLSSEFYE